MNSQKTKPRVISTFSGCGGSSCGYKQAGYDVKLAVEMDNHAVETYHLNFPDTPIYHGDIHNLSVDKVLEITGIGVGELELFDGSPPCQGFSTSGNRDFCDMKNQLYNEYIRLLRGLQPKTFVMENVVGMVKGDMKLIFKDILTQLKDSGYDVRAKLMNAMYYDCATSRQRMIFIGVRKDLGIPASHPKPQTRPKTVKECLKGYETKYPRRKSPNPLVHELLKKCKPGEKISKYHPKGHYFNYITVNPDMPIRTITKEGYGKILWKNGTLLNVDELALLQSFPVNFKWTGAPSAIQARIGNSVPPNLMKAIALHIKENILNKI